MKNYLTILIVFVVYTYLSYGLILRCDVHLSGSGVPCKPATAEFKDVKANEENILNIGLSSKFGYEENQYSVVDAGDALCINIDQYPPPSNSITIIAGNNEEFYHNCTKFLKAYIVLTCDDHIVSLKSQRKFVNMVSDSNQLQITYVPYPKK